MAERQRGARWDWDPDIWGWNPSKGRWSAEHGRPRDTVFLEISTQGIPDAETYEFWRNSVFYGFDADRRSRQEMPFQGTVRGLLSDQASFYRFESDAVAGSRTYKQARADGTDTIDIGLILSGSRGCSLQGDITCLTEPGEFFVHDAAKASRSQWAAHEGIYMTLPRRAVETALGGPMPSVDALMTAVMTSTLAPALKEQFLLLGRHMGHLSRPEYAFLLDQTRQLALFTLDRLNIGATSAEAPRSALFTAAQRYIENHLSAIDLDAMRISSSLGCSRATLYRAFADQGLTIADAIRSRRLAAARHLLGKMPETMQISKIALRCGFHDVPNFNRAFRRQFGMSPGEARQQATSK